MYRTFCELDLFEVARVYENEETLSQTGSKFDINAFFANFEGSSFFAIFEDCKNLLQEIL